MVSSVGVSICTDSLVRDGKRVASKKSARLFESTKWIERAVREGRRSGLEGERKIDSEPSRRKVADWMRREVSEGVDASNERISLNEIPIFVDECNRVSRVRCKYRSVGNGVRMKMRGVCSSVIDDSRGHGCDKNTNGAWSSESAGSSRT